jgi:nicotinamide-nucleotide amidase
LDNQTIENKTINVSIVSIGTEVTTGDIINRNAAWLSHRLGRLGFNVVCHIATPDERDCMHNAFQYVTQHSSFVFVTGGLGPTSDDFTREVIAKFIDKNLEWHEPAWLHVKDRLALLSVTPTENNRQQCYFPQGATVLINPEGTACGFLVDMSKATLIALPGPPNEISAIWDAHIHGLLSHRIPLDQRKTLQRLVTFGLSESKLSQIVDDIMADSGLETGYQVRLPYVDVKIWTRESTENKYLQKHLPLLKSALGSVIVGFNDFDAAAIFYKKLSLVPNNHLKVIDRATCGNLAKRLFAVLNNNVNSSSESSATAPTIEVLTSPPHAALAPLENNSVSIDCDSERGLLKISAHINGSHQSFEEETRYKGPKLRDRLSLYITEKALMTISQWM